MALWRSKGARKDATRGTAPVEVRKSDALLVAGVGVLPGSASPLVTGTASFAYQVGKAGFVTSRGESDGVHLFGNDGAVTVSQADDGSSLAAPGGGLSRVDIVYVMHPAAGENADTVSQPFVGVAKGLPAAAPLAPTIPVGALELARNTMTSAATSTASTGNSIAQTAARTAIRSGAGVVVGPVASSSQVDAGSTLTDVVSVSVPVTAGRVYRAFAYAEGTQVTSPGTARARVRVGTTTGTFTDSDQLFYAPSLASSAGAAGSASPAWTASATGTITVSIVASSSGGAFRVGVGAARLSVEDVTRG